AQRLRVHGVVAPVALPLLLRVVEREGAGLVDRFGLALEAEPEGAVGDRHSQSAGCRCPHTARHDLPGAPAIAFGHETISASCRGRAQGAGRPLPAGPVYARTGSI